MSSLTNELATVVNIDATSSALACFRYTTSIWSLSSILESNPVKISLIVAVVNVFATRIIELVGIKAKAVNSLIFGVFESLSFVIILTPSIADILFKDKIEISDWLILSNALTRSLIFFTFCSVSTSKKELISGKILIKDCLLKILLNLSIKPLETSLFWRVIISVIYLLVFFVSTRFELPNISDSGITS